ncbi:MAG: ATP-binding protein [Candidatus Methanoperedens sp.]|nr:ATP-binding protein [Candidatus Methanoperedens sp.]
MSSLRFRISLSMLTIIFLIVSGSYFVIQDIQTGIIEGEFRNEGFLLAKNLASEVANDILIDDLVEVLKTFDNHKRNYPEIEYIFVTDLQGEVIVHSFEKGFPKALLNYTKPKNANNEEIKSTDRGIIHEFDAPFFENVGYVHIGLSENKVRAQILDASTKLLYLAISAMILGGIFAYFISKRLTEPILKLNEGAKRINNGILDQKIDVNSRDEFSELANNLNDMASSLDQKINELLSSKEKTQDAERYLETLFNSIEDGIIVVNSDRKIIKMNRYFQNMSEIGGKYILGKTCHEMIFGVPPTQDDLEKCPLNPLIVSKKPIRFLHEVGSGLDKKTLEINASHFVYNKGIQNIIMVIRDVTQNKLIEDQILQRNRELAALNEISNIIGGTFDLDKILNRSLQTIQELTGMESANAYLFDEETKRFLPRVHIGPEEMCDQPGFQNITDVVIVEGLKNEGISNDKVVSFAIIPLKSKDRVLGLICVCSRNNHFFSARDKEFFSAIGNQIGISIENITFFENIKYLKDFNDDILNNVNLAIHVVDTDLRILAVNDELIKLLKGKINKDKIINTDLLNVYPLFKDSNVEMEYRHVIRTGEIFLSEEKTQFYGDTIFTSTSKIPIKDKNGNVEKIITVIKDISEKKKLEEELKDSYEELKLTYSKLTELYKIKDNFLANISHELRTPLTSVIGYTELMLDENLNEKQRHMTEVVFRNSKRLSRLIRGLLDSQIIESNNFKLSIEKCVVNEIISAVVEDMRTMAAAKNIQIDVNIPDTLAIDGDIERLTHVFSNLIDNAIKFTISGQINIRGEIDKEQVHVQISDTGIGIPDDKLEKIFDRFYQVDSSNSRRYGGTGLGLWISKNIIESHGGSIWAESKNSGSTFHILLPKMVRS